MGHSVIGPHPVQDFVSFRSVFSMDSRLLILLRISAIFDLALVRITALVVVGNTRSDNNSPISSRKKPSSLSRCINLTPQLTSLGHRPYPHPPRAGSRTIPR